jgi:CCR4-NOT transcription complex subunit 2
VCRDKLAPVKLNRYKDDILFFMFYTNVGDVLQLAAAAELYNRDWRYHKVNNISKHHRCGTRTVGTVP